MVLCSYFLTALFLAFHPLCFPATPFHRLSYLAGLTLPLNAMPQGEQVRIKVDNQTPFMLSLDGVYDSLSNSNIWMETPQEHVRESSYSAKIALCNIQSLTFALICSCLD